MLVQCGGPNPQGLSATIFNHSCLLIPFHFKTVFKVLNGNSHLVVYKAIHFSWFGPELFRLLLGQLSSGVVWQSRDPQASCNTLYLLE